MSSLKQKNQAGHLVLHLVLALSICTAVAGCQSIDSEEPLKTVPQNSVADTAVDSVPEFQDPSVPNVGGSGLPDLGSDVEEVDCEEAEDICDAGDWACDDIADYCDYGPDDGSELTDDWDWDQ